MKHPYAKNANLVKWGVHTLGMDEWWAHENYEAAAEAARAMNEDMEEHSKHPDILTFSYPAPWPWTDGTQDNHGYTLAKQEKET